MYSLFYLALSRRPFLSTLCNLRSIRSIYRPTISRQGSLAYYSRKGRTRPTKQFYPSGEQKAIVDAVTSGYNVQVDAVAGSGKTTTIESIAAALSAKKIQVLTYNNHLMEETSKRLKSYKNVTVNTFHGFVSQHYKRACPDDSALKSFLEERHDLAKKDTIPPIDILVIDEAQDIYPLPFELLSRMCHDAESSPQLITLGDQHQAIYQFRGSDARYLTHAKELFSHVDSLKWEHLNLKTSYRVPESTAECINKAFLRKNRIRGIDLGPLPKYIMTNTNPLSPKVLELPDLIREYKPRNTMVLVPSLYYSRLAKRFENLLVKPHKIPVYVPIGDERERHPKASAEKVIFSTFHQAKGRQADLTIVLGMEWNPYYRYPPDTCPNPLYVALTRTSKQLVLLQDTSKDRPPLPFVDFGALRATISKDSVLPTPKHWPDDYDVTIRLPRKVAVTDLFRHLHFEARDEAIKAINYAIFQKPLSREENKIMMGIPSIHKNEEVSDLTGSAVQYYVSSFYPYPPPLSAAQVLRIATEKDAYNSYRGRLAQLNAKEAYDWMGDDAFVECLRRLRAVIGETPIKSEQKIEADLTALSGRNDSMPRLLQGDIDVLCGEGPPTIVELKFTNKLENHHVLQLALYGWIYEKMKGTRPSLLLLNLKTDELREVKLPAEEVMDSVVLGLLHARYLPPPSSTLTDEEFVTEALKIKEYMR